MTLKVICWKWAWASRKSFFKDVGNDVFVRVDEKGNVLGLAILNVTRRMEKVREVKLPVKVTFSKISETIS